MPLLKRSNSQRHQGTFAQPLAKEERCVRPARLVRHLNHLKSTTPYKSASLDSSTSSTCSSDDGTKPPRKSCLTVRTLAQSLRYADQVKSNMSLCKAGYSRSELQNMEFKLLRIKLARHANAKQNLWEVLAKTTTKVSKRLTYSPMAYHAFKNSDDCERLSIVAGR
jgi:hypothetical protein